MPDQNTESTDGSGRKLTRRDYLALSVAGGGVAGLASLGAGSQDGIADGNLGIGGGPMSDEMSHARAQLYFEAESELPEPTGSNRVVRITEGGPQFDGDDYVVDNGDSWELMNFGVGSLNAEAAGIDLHTQRRAELRSEYNHVNERRYAGWQLDNFETIPGGWTVADGTMTADTDKYATGTQSAHLFDDGTDEQVRIEYDVSGIDLTGYTPVIAWRNGDSGQPNLRIDLLTSTGPAIGFRTSNRTKMGGTDDLYYEPAGVDTYTAGENIEDVETLRIWQQNGPDTETECWIDDIRFVKNPSSNGMIVFRFDDGGRSNYDYIFPAMQKYGYPGCYFVNTNNLGADHKLTWDQMQEMKEHGCLFGNHTHQHEDLVELESDEERRFQIEEAKRLLLENGHYRGAQYFVPPHHSTNDEINEIIADYNRMSLVHNYSPTSPVVSNPLLTPTVLGDGMSQVQWEEWVDCAIDYNLLLIPHFHGIEPSGTDTTLSEFEDMLEYVADKQADGEGIEVVTIDDIYRQRFA